ncbi:MAG: glycosyltransferase family 4 protein, partial [Fibrobacterota bacterium]
GAQEYLIDLAHNLNRTPHCSVLLSRCNTRASLTAMAGDLPQTSFRIHGKLAALPLDALRIRQTVRRHHIDIIHCNSIPALIAASCAHTPCPVVFTAHDSHLPALKREVVKQCAGSIIAVSESVHRYYREAGFSGKIKTIYNGLEDASEKQVAAASHPFTVAVAGRIVEKKGIHLFIDAAQSLVRTYPEVRFAVIGDPSSEYAEQLMQRVRDNPSIVFLPFFRDKDALFAEIDILVNSSVYCEPLGRTLIEAGIRRIPVIAPNRCGPVEIVEDEVSGLLFESGSAYSLAEKMERLIHNETLRAALGDGGRTVYEIKFRMEHIIERIQDFYAAVTA